MNSIQLFILSLTLTLSFSFRCLVSRCPTTPFIDNQCSYHDTMEGREVYEFKQCPLNHYCLYKNEFKINFCRSLDIRSLPGDQCTSHSDCVTDLCDNNICQGKKEGDDCDTNFQCSIGFACINQRCTVQKKENEDCSSDEDCENSFGCSRFGKCVAYFSLHVGDYSEKSLLCETMENDELGYCAESSLKQDSQICLDDQNFCDYEKNNGHDVYTMNRECECSRGHTDKKFCPLASKSEEMKIFRDMFKEIVWKNRKAHTSYRFKMSYDEERTILYYNSYPLYLDADECSIEIDMDNHKDKKNLFYFLE